MNEKSSGSRSRKQRLTAVGIRCADHVTPLYPQKLALTSPTGGGRSVGIVRVRTKATEFSLYTARFSAKQQFFFWHGFVYDFRPVRAVKSRYFVDAVNRLLFLMEARCFAPSCRLSLTHGVPHFTRWTRLLTRVALRRSGPVTEAEERWTEKY